MKEFLLQIFTWWNGATVGTRFYTRRFGEFVGANQGIGFLILQANYQLDIAGAFSLFVVLSVMGVTLHASLRWLQHRCVFWMASDEPVGSGP